MKIILTPRVRVNGQSHCWCVVARLKLLKWVRDKKWQGKLAVNDPIIGMLAVSNDLAILYKFCSQGVRQLFEIRVSGLKYDVFFSKALLFGVCHMIVKYIQFSWLILSF